MPQRKNPTPKRVSEEGKDSPVDAGPSQTPETPAVKFPDDPDLLKDIPKESLYQENEVDSWTVSASDKNEDGKFVCQKCGRDYTTSSGLRYHLQHLCEKVNRFRFTCLVCGEKLAQLEETLEHIAHRHLRMKRATRRKTRGEPSYLAEDDADNSSTAKAVDEDNEEFVPSGDEEVDDADDIPSGDDDLVEDTFTGTSRSKKVKKPPLLAKTSYASIQLPFHETLEWLFDFLFPLEKEYDVTLPNFVPEFENWVKNKEFDLSEFTKSPPLEIFEEEKRSCLFKSSGIEPFSATTPSENPVIAINAGGPVQALSWCPVPISKYDSRQLLALSTNRGLHSPEECYHESGLIQIWDCGRLNLDGDKQETPKFLFGISCAEAPIWELKWSRVGGKISGDDKNGSLEPRLGVLAAACASGVILILPIPDLAPSSNPDGQIYHAKPHMVLVPSFVEKKRREKSFGQCLSVDWTLSDGGEWIAGGYSKGIVVLWKLKDPASILLSEECGHTQLVCCRVFFAHHKAIQSLCWCPYDKAVLATCGQDRYVKIWDTHETERPLMTSQTKIGMPTQISWPILWCGLFTATEEIFAGPWNHGLLYHDVLNRLTVPYSLIPFKSACLALSFSDWMNCVVGGDSTGCAVVHANSNWNRKMKQGKKATPRVQLFNTKVKWAAIEGEGSEEDSCGDKHQKYVLAFHDANFRRLEDLEKRACFKNARLQDNYPSSVCDKPYVQAVKKLAWNPNFGSHNWIAVGLQCGLVRLHCVCDMHSHTMDQIVESLKGKCREGCSVEK